MSTLRCVRVALVVDRQRAPLAGHRAVVDDGDERRGDELAGLARVDAGALGDVVGLEAVAAGLVEQHATGAVLDHDRHRPRRRRAGAELGDRLAGGVARELLDVDGVEDLEADRVAHRLEAGLHAGVAVGDGADPQQAADDLVVGEQAVAVGDEHPLAAVAVAGRDLHDRRAGRAGGLVDAAQQLDLVGLGDLVGVALDGVVRRCVGGGSGRRCGCRRHPGGRPPRRLGGGAQPALATGRWCGRSRSSRRRRRGCRRRGRGRSSPARRDRRRAPPTSSACPRRRPRRTRRRTASPSTTPAPGRHDRSPGHATGGLRGRAGPRVAGVRHAVAVATGLRGEAEMVVGEADTARACARARSTCSARRG